MTRPRTVRRAVCSADPSLSPEANRLLTDELREVVGAAASMRSRQNGRPHRRKETK